MRMNDPAWQVWVWLAGALVCWLVMLVVNPWRGLVGESFRVVARAPWLVVVAAVPVVVPVPLGAAGLEPAVELHDGPPHRHRREQRRHLADQCHEVVHFRRRERRRGRPLGHPPPDQLPHRAPCVVEHAVAAAAVATIAIATAAAATVAAAEDRPAR